MTCTIFLLQDIQKGSINENIEPFLLWLNDSNISFEKSLFDQKKVTPNFINIINYFIDYDNTFVQKGKRKPLWKNSKTTIRELSAKYRSVLRKCLVLNAMALAVVLTSSNLALLLDKHILFILLGLEV